jgi:hypothetical protein
VTAPRCGLITRPSSVIESEAPQRGGASWSLAQATKRENQDAQKRKQRHGHAADAKRLQQPSRGGGKHRVGGQQQQAADETGGRSSNRGDEGAVSWSTNQRSCCSGNRCTPTTSSLRSAASHDPVQTPRQGEQHRPQRRQDSLKLLTDRSWAGQQQLPCRSVRPYDLASSSRSRSGASSSKVHWRAARARSAPPTTGSTANPTRAAPLSGRQTTPHPASPRDPAAAAAPHSAHAPAAPRRWCAAWW